MNGRDPFEVLGAFYKAHQSIPYEPRPETPRPEGFFLKWRRRPWITPLIFLVVLLSLAFFPDTGWLFKGAIRGLSIGSTIGLEPNATEGLSSFERFAISQTSGRERQMLDALGQTRKAEPSSNLIREHLHRVDALWRYANENPKDVEALAHIVRYHGKFGSLSRTDAEDKAKLNKSQAEKNEVVKRLVGESLLKAAEEGNRRDPGNAYFLVAKAAALRSLDRKSAWIAALDQASDAKFYRDYATDEAKRLVQAIKTHFGDRPYSGQLTSLASVMFPHFTMIRAAIPKEGISADQRKRWSRVGLLMARDSDTLIGLHVGVSVTERVLAANETVKSNEDGRLRMANLARRRDLGENGGRFYQDRNQVIANLVRASQRSTEMGLEDESFYNVSSQLTQLSPGASIFWIGLIGFGSSGLLIVLVRWKAARRIGLHMNPNPSPDGALIGVFAGVLSVVTGLMTIKVRGVEADTSNWYPIAFSIFIVLMVFARPAKARFREALGGLASVWLLGLITAVLAIGWFDAKAARVLDAWNGEMKRTRELAATYPGGADLDRFTQN